MFSFHKPKVYRSSTGCCICKAKSSSSRFTDSKKYEEDFVDCFQLPEKRCGEVCNACVLLVKRWKKLPEGNGRNWRHVVDARAGPGTKSMTKFKSRNFNRPKPKRKSIDEDQDEPVRKKKPRKLREVSPGEDQGEEGSEESPEGSRSPTPSEDPDDGPVSKRLSPTPQVSGFVDLTIWKREKICCGTIFVGPDGSIIVDPRFAIPCRRRRNGEKCEPLPPPPVKATKVFSDASSDSGYDESSNQSTEIIRQPIPATN
ncbi:SIN3-HDAC complex-associated factor [Cimex lectularius]|uniref:SIN3-HDAC complex-associated factor n=1 Tax=Cimex lectularius TaxID=79782 RepID=A0A8I6SAR6_CIMLE|nr:SIN3-HDAC complex-associated factor [Cimex lectularius]XP_014261435.1 SIN3-HDAC complex-associated factor [Cimex lectularius]